MLGELGVQGTLEEGAGGPSFSHREGLPRCLLTSLSLGMTLLVWDSPVRGMRGTRGTCKRTATSLLILSQILGLTVFSLGLGFPNCTVGEGDPHSPPPPYPHSPLPAFPQLLVVGLEDWALDEKRLAPFVPPLRSPLLPRVLPERGAVGRCGAQGRRPCGPGKSPPPQLGHGA